LEGVIDVIDGIDEIVLEGLIGMVRFAERSDLS
jgi:hypothetical protein